MNYKKKCFKLVYFKELISDLEVIYEYIKFLRTKGSSLEILITIKTKYPDIEYKLNKNRNKFEYIREFLFLAKTDYIRQLDSIYKQKKQLRFLFEKLLRNIIKHFYGGCGVLDILSFIINNADSKKEIKYDVCANPKKAEDYISQYKIYTENIFDNILD